MDINRISEAVIVACIEVHRALGPSAYLNCLKHELELRRIRFRYEVPLPVIYKGLELDCGYRLDLIVEESVVVEVKSVQQLDPIHEAQLLTYLRLGGCKLGLLINFNVPLLKDGIKRRVNKL
jgi:GxxExxY protein